MTNYQIAKSHIAALRVPKQPYREQKWGRPFSHEMANLQSHGIVLSPAEMYALQNWFGQSIHDGTTNRCDYEPPWNWRY